VGRYVWLECTKAKFIIFMTVIFVLMPALCFHNTSTFGILAGQNLSSKMKFISGPVNTPICHLLQSFVYVRRSVSPYDYSRFLIDTRGLNRQESHHKFGHL
jgi:hypothetical protein